MKRLSAIFVVMLLSVVSYACPVCEKRQPKVLRGITHGGGPEGNLDYFIVWGMVLIVLVTLYYSVKFLMFPRESNEGHIKRLVID
jgi:hypothetical protein